MTTIATQPEFSSTPDLERSRLHGAVRVALLIASEFMPVSLLTPIAHDLHATDGMAGQAISISGLFAVVDQPCSSLRLRAVSIAATC